MLQVNLFNDNSVTDRSLNDGDISVSNIRRGLPTKDTNTSSTKKLC